MRDDAPDREVAHAAVLVARGRRVTVLSGAGVSTDSGIPDFRGPQGVWTRNPAAERLSSLQAYVSDPEVRREAWRQRATHPVWTARPAEVGDAGVRGHPRAAEHGHAPGAGDELRRVRHLPVRSVVTHAHTVACSLDRVACVTHA